MTSAAAFDDLPLFAGLSPATRARLLRSASTHSYARNAALFRAGERAPGIYVVLTGRVRVLRSRDGRQYVVHTEERGGTLAELAFFEDGMLPATAIAVQPTRCLLLRRDALRSLMRDDPDLAWLFLRRLSSRVRELVSRLDSASTQAVPARLAAFMLSRMPSTARAPFTLGMTQLELAEELGTVREVVVRALGRLRRVGVIGSAGRGRYSVRDAAALRVLAGT